MSQPVIDKELISDPRLYSLALRLGDADLHILIYRGGEPEATIYRRVALDPAMTPERALEEAVYDNPLLLADFSRVTVLTATQRRALLPDELTGSDPDTMARMAALVLPDIVPDADSELIYTPVAPGGVTAVTAIDAGLAAFLRRTFNNPAVLPAIAPLARYFYDSSRIGHSGKIYVNVMPGVLDLLSFTGDKLDYANTFRFRETVDAVYYIMSVRAMLTGRDGDDRELLLAGDAALRNELTPQLRTYAGYVMPVINPSTLTRAPKDALNAPFDLIILPLCE